MKRYIIAFAIILAVLLTGSFSGSDELHKKIDALFAPSDNPEIPGGFAVALVKEGKVIFKKAYGYANNEYNIPFKPSTVFDFASVAKQFTGLAAAMLIEQGKLSMEDDIVKYIPQLPACCHKIKVKHLLYHTSGLRDWVGLVKLSGRYSRDVITDEFLMKLVRNQRELNFSPGDRFLYSNTGYLLLAKIIVRITEMPFSKWTQENVFKPLNMNDTFFCDDHTRIIKNRSAAYKRNMDGKYVNHPNQLTSYGSSSLYSTLDDMIKWVINYDLKKLGSSNVWDMMLKKGVLNDGKQTNYGFGLSIGDYRGLPRYGHGGSWAGYLCDINYFPRQRITYVLMINRDPSGVYVYNKIYDLLFDLKPLPQTPTREPEEKIKTIEVHPQKLDDYIGTFYSSNRSLSIRFEREGTDLVMHLPWQQNIKGYPESKDQFYFPQVELRARFERNSSGEANLVNFVFKDRLSTYKKVYQNLSRWPDVVDLVGKYYCPELNTEYQMVLDKDRLYLKHLHNEDVLLERLDRDYYISDQWWFTKVRFIRNKQNRVQGFLLNADGDQIQNLRFNRKFD